MSNKELKTRIQMKNDTSDAWQRVSDPSQVNNVFIPLLGEPIFYREEDGEGYKFSMKIGDGIRTPEALPSFNPGEVATEEDIESLFVYPADFTILYCTNRWEDPTYGEPVGGNGVVRLTLGSDTAVDNNTWSATLYGHDEGTIGPYTSTIEPGGTAEIDFEALSGYMTNACGRGLYAVVEFSINGVKYTETTDTVYYP